MNYLDYSKICSLPKALGMAPTTLGDILTNSPLPQSLELFKFPSGLYNYNYPRNLLIQLVEKITVKHNLTNIALTLLLSNSIVRNSSYKLIEYFVY